MRDALLILLVALICYRIGVQDGYSQGWSDYEGEEISVVCRPMVAANGEQLQGRANEQRPN